MDLFLGVMTKLSYDLKRKNEASCNEANVNNLKGSRTIAPPRQFPLRIIAPKENCSPKNCPIIKFPPKIIAHTQVNFPKRVLRVN